MNRSKTRHAQRSPIRRPRIRPGVERLDDRTLLSVGLDPGFGQAGQVIGTFGSTNGSAKASALAIQPDGKIVVSGTITTGSETSYEIVVERFDADGTIDTTFGQGGTSVVASVPDGNDLDVVVSNKVLIQPDGKIVLAASFPVNQVSQNDVIRLDADGSLDSTFGLGGFAGVTNLQATSSTIAGLALQADGKIVLAGTAASTNADYDSDFAAERLDPNGTIDTTFGNGGLAAIVSPLAPGNPSEFIEGPSASALSVAVEANGDILLGGQTSPFSRGSMVNENEGIVLQLNPSGELDTTFGTNGYAKTFGLAANSVAIQPDGKIDAVGADSITSGFTVDTTQKVTQLNADGSADSTYNGVVTTFDGIPLSGSNAFLSDVSDTLAIAPNGKVVTAGGPEIVARLDLQGNPDPSLAANGIDQAVSSSSFRTAVSSLTSSLAIGTNGRIAVVADGSATLGGTTGVLLSVFNPGETPGDYFETGTTDPALDIPSSGVIAIRPSTGEADAIIPFGIAGTGQTIAAPGDYDGSGRTEVGAYFPSAGAFAYRPANGSADVVVPFGIAGSGQSIPVPGNYDGSAQTELAVYLPSIGAFAYRPANGGPDVIEPFGFAGQGKTIPAPADYFGTGQDDIAAYLPSLGDYAIRNPAGGPDEIIPFGIAGDGQSIPVPGDYDGSGKAEIAVYLPSIGSFAYRPANGGPDVIVPFGLSGTGQSIPMPGDYDGSGRTELAVYMPSLGLFAYRPANGGPDVIEQFGITGAGQSIPFITNPPSNATSTTAADSVQAKSVAASALIPLDEGDMPLEPGSHKKGKTTT
jgi:uncharacterized delta-60 repeat protein